MRKNCLQCGNIFETPLFRAYKKCCSRECFKARHLAGIRRFHGATPRERFDKKVMPIPESGCLIWMSVCIADGYGHFWLGKWVKAHRWSYEQKYGPIPDDLVLDHLCRVRCCVNPDHLEAVTSRVNCLRGISRSALNAKKTICQRGHALSGANLKIETSGSRSCRKCNRDKNIRYKLRNRIRRIEREMNGIAMALKSVGASLFPPKAAHAAMRQQENPQMELSL